MGHGRFQKKKRMKNLLGYLILLFFSLPCFALPPLSVNQAFQFSVNKQDSENLNIHFKMAKGYYLYQDRLHFISTQQEAYTLGQVHLPPALNKIDKQGKLQHIYQHHLSLRLPILAKKPGETSLQVQFQGCSEDGFCYPPQKQTVMMQIGSQLDLLTVSTDAAAPAPLPPSNRSIESLFTQTYTPLILLSFFGLGLLLAFSPCVLPMVPVLSGIILSQREALSSKKAFLLSLSYVLGLSLSYAFIGLCFALLGQNAQLLFQSPWMHGTLAFLFMILALGMFDFYELRPPAHWQTWIHDRLKLQKGGSYFAVAMLGAFSTLILSPCVTPPLVGALAYIANTGHLLLGSSALFFLGLGSGMPLLLISTGAAHYLPKTGHWMYAIKIFFGLLLLGLAIQLLNGFISAVLSMALWGGLTLSIGIFMGAFTPAYSPLEKAKQSLGFIFLLMGSLMLIGATMGHTNPFQPLTKTSISSHDAAPSFIKVNTMSALHEAMQAHLGQIVMLDFYADWCNECKYLAHTTFQEPALKKALKQIQVIQVDITAMDAESSALLASYHVIAPPTFLFFDRKGNLLTSLRIDGARQSAVFINHIQKASVDAAYQAKL